MRLGIGIAPSQSRSLCIQKHLFTTRCLVATPQQVKIGKRWKEYQGCNNWEGLLDPLDENLRGEILRYGKFVDATYNAFDFDPSSPSYATCLQSKQSLLQSRCGYRVIKNLHATSGIQLPRWTESLPSWMTNRSSWIGYVAVCQDEEEIERLGRRDVVIAFRGTATCLEWLENLRATLTQFPGATCQYDSKPMVESGFLSLYTSHTVKFRSLQDQVREEIGKIVQSYGNEPISITITGHSLGAALATLTAYDITRSFNHSPLVTVISFGGPRVGNRCFRSQVEKCGSKILRIVNSSDLITKLPGFVINEDVEKNEDVHVAGVGLPKWLQKPADNTQWVYVDVGRELQLSTGNSQSFVGFINHNVATCHDLNTYLQLVKLHVSVQDRSNEENKTSREGVH